VSLEQPPIDHIGKYRILGVLGKGGMGIVYKGLDPDIEREVAVKTIRFDTSPDGPVKEEMLNRVMREAKAAGHLNHPNIVTIYDVIRDRELTFIVMQYVAGQTLQTMIESGKAFSPQEVLALLRPVSEALDYAHENGIVHRDIKPANILIDMAGRPYLADFGVARMETSTMTGPGTTIGTLSYMSPEQVMGKAADGRADIFALGVILYELLTGERPFAGDNLSTIVYKIVHEEPRLITEVNQDLPPGYESVIRRALAKRPEDRYQTGRDLMRDLEDPDNLAVATRDYELRTGTSGVAGTKKPRPLLPAIGLLIFAGIVGGYLILRPGGAAGSRRGPAASVASETKPIAAPPPPDQAAENRAKLRESLASGNYDQAVKLAESILRDDPGDSEARDGLEKAKAAISASQAALRLQAGIARYESGDFAACVREMEEVLRLDEHSREARDYLARADNALSKQDILAMIERRRLAEEREDLEGVLRPLEAGALTSQEQAYYSMLFTIYDGIECSIPGDTISVLFADRTHATAHFHYAVRGISKKDGKQKTIQFVEKSWTLEKRSNVWKIVRIQERT
jgi:predicted Ser/Thr protein kinase/tetratricopeptide (TPR) repeat protein